ncbi:MAG: hypothetical protein WBO17_04905 [Sphingorhabdus sp.]
MKRPILPLLFFAALSGCSNSIETRVDSAGQSSSTPFNLSYDFSASRPAEMEAAHRAVVEALGAKGYVIAENAVAHLEVTLSSRPARLALGTAEHASSLSPAKKKKPLQNCDDKEYRLVVTITKLDGGSVIYRGSAAEYHCHLPLAQAVPLLVSAALSDLGRPRGNYSVSRRGKD